MMTKKDLEKLVVKYQKRADEAAAKHRETGLARYYTTYWNNQDMADALRMAASAKDDCEALRSMRARLSNFASLGATVADERLPMEERVRRAMALARDIAEYGHRNGLT